MSRSLRSGARAWVAVAALLLQVTAAACALQAHVVDVATDAAPSFLPESAEPRFVVGILNEGKHVLGDFPLSGFVVGILNEAPEAGRGRPLTMTDANGTRFTCYLPPKTQAKGSDSSPMVAEQALQPPKTPKELLDALTDWCAYRVEEWWTYEVCYKKAARQYHADGDKVVDEYLLGNYTAAEAGEADEVHTDESEVGGAVRYVRQLYRDGEVCELTGSPREVEVRYVCAPGAQTLLASVKEPRSCSYVFTVATPRLCKHAAFQHEPPKVVPIGCYPVHPPSGGSWQGRDGASGSSEHGTCSAGDDATCSAAEHSAAAGAGSSEEAAAQPAPTSPPTNSSAPLEGEEGNGRSDADGVGLNAMLEDGDDYYY